MAGSKKEWLPRICIGGAAGVVCYILIATFFGNLNLFGPSTMDKVYFSFSMSSFLPKWLGTALDYFLWFAFGAEIGIATLPFDDRGKVLALKSLAHYALMMLTVSLWACLNFLYRPLPAFLLRDLPDFLVPVTVVYLLVWGLRWLWWYFELRSLRKVLGLGGKKEDKSHET